MKWQREPPKNKKIGWTILAITTALFFMACRIPLFWSPAGETGRLIMSFCIYLAWFLYSIFYGMFAWRMTDRVLLPALMLMGFVTLTSFSDLGGVLDTIQKVTRPPGYALPLLLYFWKSLRFGIVAAVVGGMIKNIRG